MRLGTHVYNIGLRHPFTAARGAQTVDLLSGGRFEFGIGASWLEEEWRATELDFATRGRRVDEAIEVCKQLFADETVTHHGEFFSFDEVVFEPKPVQQPAAADPRRRRVEGRARGAPRASATAGSAWATRFESAAAQIKRLNELREQYDRPPGEPDFQIIVGGAVESTADVGRWEDLGVDAHDRVAVAPLTRGDRRAARLRRPRAR